MHPPMKPAPAHALPEPDQIRPVCGQGEVPGLVGTDAMAGRTTKAASDEILTRHQLDTGVRRGAVRIGGDRRDSVVSDQVVDNRRPFVGRVIEPRHVHLQPREPARHIPADRLFEIRPQQLVSDRRQRRRYERFTQPEQFVVLLTDLTRRFGESG